MNILQRKIKRAGKIWREKGLRGFKQLSSQKIFNLRENVRYQKWIRRNDTLTDSAREKFRHRIQTFKYKPLISIVMPVYNVEEKWLRLCVESVLKQLYENWEFCIADDCSPSPHVRRILEEYARRDPRIKVVFRKENGHISEASNSALELASGEFAAFLDHDDEFSEGALYCAAEEINAHPEAALIYSDEDMIDENGKRYSPKFKPDWSPDFFYSLNLINHLSIYRTEVLRKIGGFRAGFEGSQDYDLAMRALEEIPEQNIRHIPHILYHWRAIPGSVGLSAEEKPYAPERARRAIREHLHRRGTDAKVVESYSNLHRVIYQIPENLLTSIILCEHQDSEIEKILATIAGENFELLAIGKASPNFPKVKFIERQKSVAASFNSAATEAEGQMIIFLNKQVTPLNKEWLRELTSHALRKEVGAVGGKILNDDQTVKNAGIVLGIDEKIGFANRGIPADASGNLYRAAVINNFSAVSGAFAVRREIFAEGFDAKSFPDGLFEIDFCLRLLERGYRNVFTPYAEFVQTGESTTEKMLHEDSPEILRFKNKWAHFLQNDPYYNPNFSASKPFRIEPSRSVK